MSDPAEELSNPYLARLDEQEAVTRRLDRLQNAAGNPSANERQVGGDHYREASGEQHWDMMWRLYREAWFIGNITKYLFRYRRKDGLKDLRKGLHYYQKLLELEEAAWEEEARKVKEKTQ